MKVVVNKCYGGFGLSHEAVELYARLKEITLYAYVDKREKDGSLSFGKLVQYKGQKNIFCIHYLTERSNEDGTYRDEAYFSVHGIERNDPAPVSVVEELGERANGLHANLVVVDIPDDVKWFIGDYDGVETIHENHRVW